MKDAPRSVGLKEKMNETSVRPALSRLMAPKNNPPGGITVDQKYAGEFHSILDTLEEGSGQNLDDYLVPGSVFASDAPLQTRAKRPFPGVNSFFSFTCAAPFFRKYYANHSNPVLHRNSI